MVLSPNPTNNLFTLIARSSSNEPLTVRVMDAAGRIAHEIKGRPNQSFTFGDGLLSGIYMVEVRQGKVVKTIKAVKE